MQFDMAGVISISSHVAHGAVGNRIIVPALETLGISVTAINTVQLPWHPGMNAVFGKGTRIVPDDIAFAAMVDNLAAAPWLGEINGIVTGYLGSPAQAVAIARLITALKFANPNALYLCDPVIGDTGGLYIPEATATAIRNHLWPLSDIVTPNLFEFNWMTGYAEQELPDIVRLAKALNKPHVVVTSASTEAGKIGNLVISNNITALISHQALTPSPNGTGDLLAALLLGNIVQGKPVEVALATAASTVLFAISHANHHQKSNLSPERLQDMIGKASIDILVETLT
jgi:pyridoxine kinase